MILFCIAAFSTSLAKWTLGDDSNDAKKVQSNAANFYVEYPQYVSNGGVVVPQLEAGTYYLQVQKDGGMSDYYAMADNPDNSAEKMLTSVYLKKNTVLDMYYGKNKDSIKNKKDGSSAEFEHVSNNTAATAKVTATGYYDFYYEYGSWTMYSKYNGTGGSSGTGSGTTTTVPPTRDLTKRSVKVNFNGGVSVVFEAINHDDAHDLNFHIWKSNGDGNETSWPGLNMNKDADDSSNTFTFNFDVSEIKGIIINCSNGRTGGDTWFFDEKFSNGLKANYTYTFDLSNLHNCVEGDESFKTGNKLIAVTEKEPQTVTTGGNAGNTGNTGGTLNTAGYTELFSVKFSDDDQVKKLYFKTATGATAPYNDLSKLAVHIRHYDHKAYYYNTNSYNGTTSGDGNMRFVTAYPNPLKDRTLEVGTKATTVIVFGFEEAHITGATTHSGVQYLADYAVGEINLITLHKAVGVAPTVKSSSSGGGGSESDDITPAEPDFEGSTVFDASQETKLSDKKTVREVTSGVQGEDRKYVYKNYICVSRKNSAATTADNSIAYLEFEVTDSTVNPYDVKVMSLTLKRRATDANGNIKNRFVDPAPRIYNYDPNLDTRLGQDTSDAEATDPNKKGNENRKMIFARGIQHTSYESAGQMKPHFDDGVYVVLYFGDNDQQYFALDIEIELEIPAGVTVPAGGFNFTLKAQAANKNSWERYEDGFGEPWGYYMGGLINSVETWDPSRTTKLERASDRYVTKYDSSRETPIVGDIETATDATINSFNERSDFNYKIIRYYNTEGFEGYVRYPKGKIDVSLTVNLTEGSLIKMYMLDHDGDRKGGHTAWIVPNELVYDEETKKLFRDETYDVYDEDVNIIIPKTGTYIFRLVGYFRLRDEEVEDSNGNILKGDRICYETGKRCEVIPSGKNGKALDNFNFWVDTLYVTCSSASEGNSEFTITLNSNGGTFADEYLTAEGDTATKITRKVTFGSDIKNLPKPTRTDNRTLLGWYYEDADGNAIDFDFGSPVTGNLNLFAKWAANYRVTFDANGGDLPSGATNPIVTDEYGNLTKEQLNAVKPTRAGYRFLGWYSTSAQTGGIHITADTTFTADRIVYARWEQTAMYTVTFNYNGLPGMTNATQEVAENDKAKQPTAALPTHYHVSGWYTDSSCTTAYNFNTAVTSASAKTLYAKWYADNGIYFDGVWAHGLTKNEDNDDGTEYMALDVELDKADGAVVTVWYDQEKCKVKKDNDFADEGATEANLGKGIYNFYYKYGSTTATNNGLWIAGYYVVTFNANGGTWNDVSNPHTQQVAMGGHAVAIDAPENAPADKMFDCWSTSESTSGGAAFDFTNTTITGNITLYAQWKDKPAAGFTITFVLDGGYWQSNAPTGSNNQVITGADGIIATADIPVAAKDGYDFKCWVDEEDNEIAQDDLATKQFSSNTTLTATWTERVDPNKDLIYKELEGTFNESTGEGGYVTGQFSAKGHTDFDSSHGYQMTFDRGDDYSFKITIYLNVGDVFKVVSDNSWLGYSNITGTKPTQLEQAESDNNIYVNTAGYFTIKVWWANNPENFVVTYSGGGGGSDTPVVSTVKGIVASSQLPWLVGEALEGGGWNNGVELTVNEPAIVHISNSGSWFKIRTSGSDGNGTNAVDDSSWDVIGQSGTNYSAKKGNGYYKFTWTGSALKAEYLGASI
ncbi:MAG: InlB B-repeat-containing protein [Clostridiales bacterium]|nr:InlB B-repeat-containing protein [Clostridiales bacterium]